MTQATRSVLAILAFCAAYPPTAGAGTNGLIPTDVRRAVGSRVANRYTPSIVVGVKTADGERFLCEGRTRWTGGEAVTPDTVYEIGSITKAFTGLLLADMVQHGEVKLTDPIDGFLPPGVKAPQRESRSITLAHLAEHSSGLPRIPSNMTFDDPDDPYASYTQSDLFDFISGYVLPRKPGEKYEYSNLGMGLLGQLLSHRAGTPYEQLLIKRILDPLHMPSTRITLTDDMKTRLAYGHNGATQVKRWNLAALAGAGDLDSTARDMLHFAYANLRSDSGPLAGAMKLAATPRQDADSSDVKVGLGWHITTRDGKFLVWHNGGTGGFRSFCGYAPDRGIAVVVLTNTSMPGVDDIGFHLLDPGSPLGKNWDRPTVRLTDRQLARLTGRYELKPGFFMDIAQQSGFLTVQPTGQPIFTLYATSPKEFFLPAPKAGGTFELDDKGIPVALVWHQHGMDQRGPRTGDVPRTQKRPHKHIDPAILARYTGKYQLLPGAIVQVTHRGDQLYARLTGQATLPVYAESETEFFYEVVDASITFEVDDSGKTTALVLHQSGIDQPAEKIE